MKSVCFIFLILMTICCNPKNKKQITPQFYQDDCSCIKDIENAEASFLNSKTAILTNSEIITKNGKYFVKGNCTDVIRQYILDKNGNESEEEKVTCISRKFLEVEITDSTQFHLYIPNETDFADTENGRKFFFEKLIKNKNALLVIEMPIDKMSAIMISRKDYLEKPH